jgi:hypothetical protein
MLQTVTDLAERFCKEWSMKYKLNKLKAAVFRRERY